MAHTNSTPNYNLPQFLPTDKPAWLVDVNPAYASIDTAIKNASDAAGNAQTDATQALADAAGANAIATQANSKSDGAIASISEQFLDTATYEVGEYVIFNNILYVCTEPVTTPGPWTGSVNWTRASLDSIATDLKSSINDLENRTGSDIRVSSSDNTTIANALTPQFINNFVMLSGNAVLNDNQCTIYGKIHSLRLYFTAVNEGTGWVTQAIIPEGHRPISIMEFTLVNEFNNYSNAECRVTPEGFLQVYNASSANARLWGQSLWIST